MWRICYKSFCMGLSPVHSPLIGTDLNGASNDEENCASNEKENTEDILPFTFEEIVNATNNFSSECLGEGRFGKVYKGYLDKVVNQVVAIKKLNQGRSHEFYVEVDTFRKVNHPNVVKLLGFCAEKEHTLVYEYMALGSLYINLFGLSPGTETLDWELRIKIAINLASAIEYLHDKMIHGITLEPSNILLGERYHVKISNLRMNSHESADLARKSDIYSLGLVLLQLITGRMPYDPQSPLKENNLVNWAMSLYRTPDRWKYIKLADPLLQQSYYKEDFRQMLRFAIWSLHPRAAVRPNIKDVIKGLTRVLSRIYPPPKSEVVVKAPPFRWWPCFSPWEPATDEENLWYNRSCDERS